MPRFSQLGSVAVLIWSLCACGDDAEARYAGLDVARLSTSDVSYHIRYLSPPWKRVEDDPLATGARKSVPVAGELVDVLPGTGLVLAIDRESTIQDTGLTYAKYVMEVAALRCTASDLTNDESCAHFLAAADYDFRATTENSGFFGPEEQRASNDAGQTYYELMTQDKSTFRYKRLAYFETDDRLLAVRLYMEANPGLADPATTHMIQTLEVLDESAIAASDAPLTRPTARFYTRAER